MMGKYLVPLPGGRRLANDEWLTPPWLIELLGPFDLDPCAAINRPWDTAKENITYEENGFTTKWRGRVWLNPPFGKGLKLWIEKLSRHGNGIAILPLRSTDTNWFHQAIWNTANSVLFPRGRIRYFYVDGSEGGSCPHASLLVAYGDYNSNRLEKATKEETRLFFAKGKFLRLR